jgi:hypothetical protein
MTPARNAAKRYERLQTEDGEYQCGGWPAD